jgi:hypothetical protein
LDSSLSRLPVDFPSSNLTSDSLLGASHYEIFQSNLLSQFFSLLFALIFSLSQALFSPFFLPCGEGGSPAAAPHAFLTQGHAGFSQSPPRMFFSHKAPHAFLTQGHAGLASSTWEATSLGFSPRLPLPLCQDKRSFAKQ